jgi:hypothetical protein
MIWRNNIFLRWLVDELGRSASDKIELSPRRSSTSYHILSFITDGSVKLLPYLSGKYLLDVQFPRQRLPSGTVGRGIREKCLDKIELSPRLLFRFYLVSSYYILCVRHLYQHFTISY